jgi:hypothetical protein
VRSGGRRIGIAQYLSDGLGCAGIGPTRIDLGVADHADDPPGGDRDPVCRHDLGDAACAAPDLLPLEQQFFTPALISGHVPGWALATVRFGSSNQNWALSRSLPGTP